jgi:hypothetical protein
MLQELLKTTGQQRLEEEMRRLSRLLEANATLMSARVNDEQLDHDLRVIVNDGNNPRLASAILMAEAEAGGHFAGERPPPSNGGQSRGSPRQ